MNNTHPQINKWLYPFSMLYGIGVALRNHLFDIGLLRSKSYDIPVISIGNITVGGTGKTPHTEFLVRKLQEEFKVAVLSRGYKRKSQGFVLATDKTSAKTLGDEPWQIKHKFPECYVAVDKDRCHGIEELSRASVAPDLDLILLDDAFQHRYVRPSINILLCNYNRPFNEDALMPAGMLREPIKAKDRANIVIVTKCPVDLKPMDYRIISKNLSLYPFQKLFFSTMEYDDLQPVFADGAPLPLETLRDNPNILLITGIASPRPLEEKIHSYSERFNTLHFDDHHDFSKKDVKQMQTAFNRLDPEKRIVITTEKDAARMRELAFDDAFKSRLYALPIKVKFLLDGEKELMNDIVKYVRTNSRDNVLHQKQDAKQS